MLQNAFPSPALGVMGRPLCERAAGSLALAHLRPTVPEYAVARHQHADMHVVLLLAGRYVSDASGMPDVCGGPAVIWNPPGTEHRDCFRSRDGLFVTLTVPRAVYTRHCEGSPVSDRAVRLPPQSLTTAMRLLTEIWEWDADSPLAVEVVFAELMAHAHAGASRAGAVNGDLRRVLERIHDDALTPPSVAELAVLAGLHPVHLARVFRRRLGLSPGEYVRKLRLHRAVAAIARGRTLALTAAATGFVDESHLHRSFTRELRMTPGAFRRLALGRRQVACVQDRLLPGC